jgi:hypothetical protein
VTPTPWPIIVSSCSIVQAGTLPQLPLTHSGNTVFIHKTTPPGPRRQWFPLAVQDTVLFHAIIVTSAADMAGVAKSRPPVAFFYHRGEVIRLVRKSILHAQTATSDGTIGAIACLLVTDVNFTTIL